MKNRIVCFMLACMLIASGFSLSLLADASAAVSIESVEDFLAIRSAPDRDYVIAVPELDFAGVSDFTPFETFTGSLTCSAPGGKCTLKNLTIHCANAKTGAGLFNFLGGTVDGLIIDASCSLVGTTNAHHIGMIAGYAGAGGKISNCINYANVSGNTAWAVAGILGTAFAENGTNQVTDCINYGDITNANAYAAGIVALSNKAGNILDVRDCANYGNVISSASVAAGIVGYINRAGTVTLERCINAANVSAGKNAGGLIGGCVYNAYKICVTMTESASIGDLTGGSSTGGLMGAFTRFAESSFAADSCYVRGHLSSNSSTARVCGLLGEWNWKFVPSVSVRNSYLAASFSAASGSAYVVSGNNNQDANGTFENNYFHVSSAAGTTLYGGYQAVPIESFQGIEIVRDGAEMTQKMSEKGLIGQSGAFFGDSSSLNDGYPIFKWQGSCTHTNVRTTCTEKVCLDCNEILESFADGRHSFEEWREKTPASIVFDQVDCRVCSVCQLEEERTHPHTALGYLEQTDGIYRVTTAEQLLWLSHHVTSGNILLERDITIDAELLRSVGKNDRFEGLGSAEAPFSGSFDGNGKALTLKTDCGLFDYLGDCTVKRLNIFATLNQTDSNRRVIGALANRVAGACDISEVNVAGSIRGFYCGGLIGIVEANGKILIKNAVNTAEIWSYALDNENGSAGLVGTIRSGADDNVIEDCQNKGYITSSGSLVAGIVGRVVSETGHLVVRNCSNQGKIACYGANQSAGIAGFVKCRTEIDHCTNAGQIIGSNMGTGGIVGRCNASSNLMSVQNCVNLGKIEASYIYGGIVGYLSTGTNYQYDNNVSVTTLGGAGRNEASEASGTLLPFQTRMAFRFDDTSNGVTVRFKLLYSAEQAEQAGISVGKLTVGDDGDDGFVAWTDVTLLQAETEGELTVLTVIANKLPEKYINHDLTVRAELTHQGVVGYYQASISFAAAAEKLSQIGYPSSNGDKLDTKYQNLLDEWKAEQKTIVMIGDSITDGARSTLENHRLWDKKYDRDVTYPGRLQALLGSAYQVINCGYSGRTMCTNIRSYTETSEWTEAINAKADIAFIMLGTNDADYNNVQMVGAAFEAAYKTEYFDTAKKMINQLIEVNPNVEIYICTSPESYRNAETAALASVGVTRAANTQINLALVRSWQAELVNELRQNNLRVHLFDMYDVTNDWSVNTQNHAVSEVLQYFNQDLLHPNDRGYAHMAKAVYDQIFQ